MPIAVERDREGKDRSVPAENRLKVRIVVRTGIGSLAPVTGFPITVSVGLLVAADAVIYLIPGEGCDSGCWYNTPFMRALGILGLAVAAGLMASTPGMVKLIRARRYRHRTLIVVARWGLEAISSRGQRG